MPDMDGESLLRALRAVPGLEAVPFIALSAVRSEARIRAVVGAGADAFLLKPFPLRELTDKVRSLVERPQAARQIRGPLGEDMQPTRPVVRAPHTMSTTSLRRRAPQTQPPLPPEPKAAPASSETGPYPAVARPREPGPPLILEPSAVRLADPEPEPEPGPRPHAPPRARGRSAPRPRARGARRARAGSGGAHGGAGARADVGPILVPSGRDGAPDAAADAGAAPGGAARAGRDRGAPDRARPEGRRASASGASRASRRAAARSWC